MDELAARRRRNRIKRVILWVSLVVIVAAAVWVFYFSNLLTVKKISVVGKLQHASVSEIVSTVEIKNGTPLARLNQNQIRESLNSIPAIAEVEVRRVWPSEVVLAITERTPVAVKAFSGGWKLLDASGIEFGKIVSKPDGLVQVSAKTDFAQMAAVEIIPNFPKWLESELVSVQAESANDVRFLLVGQRLVKFGNSQEQAQKFKVLKTLLTIKASIYDVSAPNLPITRK